MGADPSSLTLTLATGQQVSALLMRPPAARACLVLAHGAGAGMEHRSMSGIAQGFADREVATLRFQFPFMENGSKRPDPPALAHATVRAAVGEAACLMPNFALFAGGRSFGGRMTSQAQAASPLSDVLGLVFFAFPLHPAKRPARDRAAHLSDVSLPMLFLSGTRDALADPALLRAVLDDVRPHARLHALSDADHAFHVPARSGTTDAAVLDEALDVAVEWIAQVSRQGGGTLC